MQIVEVKVYLFIFLSLFVLSLQFFSSLVSMLEELPKRLFKGGEEIQVNHINNNCKLVHIMGNLEAWLPKELKKSEERSGFFTDICLA